MKNTILIRRIFSMLLVLLMVLTMVPVTGLAATGKTVYFANTAGWTNVNVYYWSDSSTSFVTWPGKAMTLEQDKIYSYDLPAGVDYVIFNNGNTQTKDLSLPEDNNMYHYDTDQWSQYGCAHVWAEERVLTPATCTEAGEVSLTCSVCGEVKTAATEPLGHDYTGSTCSRCGLEQVRIFFDSTGSGWSQPYIYTWTGSTTHCGAWPGTKMEAVDGEDGLFVYGLSELPDNVIFNNGNGGDGNQTKDLTVPTDGKNCYHFADGSWTKHETCKHDWDEGTVTTPATCTTDGVMTITCTLCGEVQTNTIPAKGHSFENGSCSVCGALASCTEHSWDEGTVTEENTCWMPGTLTYTCVLCGATKDEYIYPGHDTYVAQIIEPTCTSTGKEITKCTRCAYSYDRTLPKIAHNYEAGDTVPPTCTVDGYTIYTCTACSATTEGDLVYHTGHSWSGNSCVTCGAVCEHNYEDGICTLCGNGGPKYVQGYYEIENAAQLYWFAAQVNSGNNAINGKLVADIDLKNGTWTSIGYYLSDTLTPDTIPYTGTFDGQGHTVSNFATAGTDNEGLFGYCSSATILNLGIVNAEVSGWRAGAVAGYALTSNIRNCFAKDCTIIGKTTNSVAQLSGTVYIAPVAGPQGGIVRNCYALNCTLKGDTTLEVYTSPVGGTDTQNGYYCNVACDSSFSSVRNSTEVTMDQLVSGEVTYALNQGVTDGTQGWYQTCGEGLPAHSGKTVYQVFGCGSSAGAYSNDPDSAAEHSYSGAVTKEATCAEDGIKTFTCSQCGDSYTEAIPAIGHSYETVTVDATCTEDGAITDTCTTCGDTKVEAIPALGHSYETVTVDATCTEDGSISDTCATCGDTKVEVIPATGHSYADGICGTCGAADPDYVAPIVKPTLKLKAPTLEFKDMITVNAFFTAENIQDVVEMGMITYSYKADVVSVETAEHKIPGASYIESSDRYMATSQGIHAKYLGDTVYLAIYAELKDGTYVYTILAPYSPVDYATNQLNNSTDMKLKQLCAAMLNYGAEAQLFFGHNTSALANASLTDEQKSLPEAYRADMVATVPAATKEKQGKFANNQGFANRTPSISFEGAFCINYFFTPNYAPVDALTMYYWNEADFNAVDVLTVESASGSFKMNGTGTSQYHGSIEGIAAKDLSEAVYVAVTYSDGATTWTSGVLGYSIGSYCSSQASKGVDVSDLSMATAVYGYHAKQYFG